MEESFQTGKEPAGLDEHQGRRWTAWHCWTTLAIFAHTSLAVTTVAERLTDTAATALTTLTVNEFRRLFDALLPATPHRRQRPRMVALATKTSSCR
jgi:hypothetical protein